MIFFLSLFCSRFLTTAISCKALAHSYRMGYSTVNTIVNETCAAIWKHLQPLVMPKPTPELWTKIEEEFKTKWNFPNCIGAIDGKHVNIRAPWNSGSLFFNYKKFFSIVLLAVADANYNFVVVDIGAYGRNSDSGILSGSKLGQLLQTDSLCIPPNKRLPGNTEKMPHVFVGDEAFPLSKHMMRPYPGNQLTGDEEKKIFNYRLSRARRIVESSFGILTQKFEVFQKKIRMQPKYLDLMILACTCLHNYIRTHDHNEAEEVRPPRNSILQNINVQQEEDNQIEDGMIIRDNFKSYFNSQNGAVPWQNEMIRRVV